MNRGSTITASTQSPRTDSTIARHGAKSGAMSATLRQAMSGHTHARHVGQEVLRLLRHVSTAGTQVLELPFDVFERFGKARLVRGSVPIEPVQVISALSESRHCCDNAAI